MYSSVCSGGLCGIKSYISSVEIDVSKSLPSFEMVGRLSNEVKEARERVKVALKNCGIEIPPVKITVNISPAHIHKSGTAYDLPIAVGVLNTLGLIPDTALENMIVLGELGLNGDLKAVNGVLPILTEAYGKGITCCVIPADNADEAAYVEGMNIIVADNMVSVMSILKSPNTMADHYLVRGQNLSADEKEPKDDFADIIGQEACIRAATVAVAGFHHMMMIGPPGAGKTMIAKRMATIMPEPDMAESLEVSSIYSVSGLLNRSRPYIRTRPFMAPHHTATVSSLTGGGINPRPGIMSLAHRGVLFLDEFPEFSRESIEALREPLESKSIQVVRAKTSFVFPADFMLVAAANPCPCGYYPDRNKCNCPEHSIARYRSRISGPIRDRIDIIASVSRLDAERVIREDGADRGRKKALSSEDIKTDVMKAIEIQKKRYKGTGIRYNSELSPSEIDKYCELGKEEKEYMKDIYDAMDLTARSYHKILKVARTIADLDGCSDIKVSHLSEAVCYRG